MVVLPTRSTSAVAPALTTPMPTSPAMMLRSLLFAARTTTDCAAFAAALFGSMLESLMYAAVVS